MMDVTPSESAVDWRESAFDLTRGIAVYTGSPLVRNLAKAIARHPQADLSNAFNHKQVACKMWARDRLFDCYGGRFDRIWILGGWYGVLAAMLFDDPRFEIAALDSIDIDPEVGAVARTINQPAGDRFNASTGDMYALDYRAGRPDLVVNTSCEHIADVRGWLTLLPEGTRVLLQSNDYFSEPTHINCVATLEAFEIMAGLRDLRFSGSLPMKNYTRFMLIGSV